MIINTDKLIEQLGVPDEEGVLKWEYEFSLPKKGDWYWDERLKKWRKAGSDFVALNYLVATPIKRKPKVPKKVKVKARLFGSKNEKWDILEFPTLVYLGGMWLKYLYGNEKDWPDNLPETKPGKWTDVNIYVDAVSPELEDKRAQHKEHLFYNTDSGFCLYCGLSPKYGNHTNNGGVVCDTLDGPCSCGAWYTEEQDK